MGTELQRDVGRHDAQIESLQDDMRSLKSDVHDIKTILSEARGGWRILMLVGGVAAAIGALVAKISTWMQWVPR